MVTTPSLRVYPLLYLPHLDLCHIKTIYGPYMGHPHSKNWTLDFAPAFSPAGFLPLEPTIHFSHWSAVSHSKTRDFRFPWARDPFFLLVSGFPHRKWLMTSPEVPLVTWSLSTNQKPGNYPYERSLLLAPFFLGKMNKPQGWQASNFSLQYH